MPLATLISWISNFQTVSAIGYSLFFALPLALWMWFSVQSANLIFKWPTLQLVGWTTTLISVVIICLPLHLLLSGQTTGLIALFLWICFCIYGVIAANKIQNKTLTLTTSKINRKYRFVQLSDIHVGSRSPAFLKKSILQANNHNPDAVFITGDLLDSSAVDSDCLAALRHVSCPAWMCLGNHERYVVLEEAIDAIENNNTVILRNRSISFDDICLTGIDDSDNPQQVANEIPDIERDKNLYNILLYHKPDGWQAACDHNIDLMLAGHTHAGQIWPFGALVKLQFKHVSGHFRQDNKHLYVSPGTGTWGPILRLGTRCEMTVIDLIPAT